MFTCSFKLSRKAQPQANLTGHRITSFVAQGMLLIPCLISLPISISGSPLPIALQSVGIENSDALRIVYAFAIIFILIVIAYLAKKYIRIPGERSDLLHIPDLAPEVRVWDDTNVESLISLHGETVPVFSPNQKSQKRDRWPGLIPAILHYLGFRDTGRNLSVYRKYLLETLEDEVKARIRLRELAINHKYVEQESINHQLILENRRLELLAERREIEAESRWRRAQFEHFDSTQPSQLPGNNYGGGQSQNYLSERQAPDIRCTFRASFNEHWESVESVSFSPDGKFLASGGWDEFVRIWDLQNEHSIRALPAPSKVHSVAFSPENQNGLLAAGLDNGSIQLWKTEKGGWQREDNFGSHSQAVGSIAFSPDGKFVASGGWDKRTMVWDALSVPRTAKHELTECQEKICQVSFWPDRKEKVLAVLGWDRNLYIHDLDSLKARQQLFPKKVSAVAFSLDCRLLAVASLNGEVTFLNVATQVWKEQNQISLTHLGEVSSLSFTPDGEVLAIGYTEGTIEFWRTETCKKIESVRRHSGAITCVTFSPDGKILASASRDRSIKLWDMRVSFPSMPPRD